MKRAVNDPIQLYQEAEDADIDVYWMPLQVDQSMAVQLEDGSCAIGIDPWRMATVAEETVMRIGRTNGRSNGSSRPRLWEKPWPPATRRSGT